MIRAILFEDVKKYQQRLKTLFDSTGKIYLTACFSNAKEAVKQVKNHNPDVVLMDIEMPFVSGVEALQQIKSTIPATKVLMLTSVEADDKIFAALCFGASGYVLKTDEENIEKAVEDVNSGGGYFSPSIGVRIARLFQSHIATNQKGYVELTDKQKDVLTCMVDGMKSKEIGEKLFMAFDTVRGHVKEIYRKLHVNSAQEAVREAIQRGLV